MIDLFAASLVHLSHTLGGSFGFAVIAVSGLIRMVWLPVAVHFAVKARERAAALVALKPQLDAAREAHSDPLEQLQAVQAIQSAHGLSPRLAHFAPLLVQAPVLYGLFAAVRRVGSSGAFLWIPNLARPDALLAAAASSLMAVGVMVGADSTQTRVFGVVAAVVFFVVASRMAASVGLLMATSAAASAVQAFFVRRRLSISPS